MGDRAGLSVAFVVKGNEHAAPENSKPDGTAGHGNGKPIKYKHNTLGIANFPRS